MTYLSCFVLSCLVLSHSWSQSRLHCGWIILLHSVLFYIALSDFSRVISVYSVMYWPCIFWSLLCFLVDFLEWSLSTQSCLMTLPKYCRFLVFTLANKVLFTPAFFRSYSLIFMLSIILTEPVLTLFISDASIYDSSDFFMVQPSNPWMSTAIPQHLVTRP